MRARLVLAVTASAGLSLSACTSPSSTGDGVDVAAVDAAAAIDDAAEPQPGQVDEPLVVEVNERDPATPEAATSSTLTTPEPATTATTATSEPASTTTTLASTTTASTTTASTTTSAPAAAVETRPEILRLALPTFGGGTFDPDSVAGRNIVLWFWGAH